MKNSQGPSIIFLFSGTIQHKKSCQVVLIWIGRCVEMIKGTKIETEKDKNIKITY